MGGERSFPPALMALIDNVEANGAEIRLVTPCSSADEFESEIRANHPNACDALDLVVDASGKVTGKAHGCKGSGDVDVTGTLTAARP